jgi:hypothetical protein
VRRLTFGKVTIRATSVFGHVTIRATSQGHFYVWAGDQKGHVYVWSGDHSDPTLVGAPPLSASLAVPLGTNGPASILDSSS